MALSDFYNDRQAFNDLVAGQKRNMLARQAGGMIAGGDTSGAANALFKGGELDAGFKLRGQVDAQADAQHKKEVEFAGNFAAGIAKRIQGGVPADRAWAEGQQWAASQGMGEALPGLQTQWERLGPEGFVSWLGGAAEKAKLEIVKAGDGSYSAVDTATGRPVYQWQAPTADKYEQFDPEKEIRRIPGRPGSEGGPEPVAPSAAPAANADQTVAAVTGMGGRVTSGARTPEENARVGGVPNSYHLTTRGGVARDLVPPQGMGMGEFHAEVKRRLPPGWEAINEGDHVHIEPGPGAPRQVAQAPTQSGAPELVRPAQPKASQAPGHMATAQEKVALGLDANVPYWIDGNGATAGKPSPLAGEKPNKPLTEYQGKSVEYLNAALSGNERMNELAGRGIYKPQTATDSLFKKEKDGTVRLILRSDADRQYMQAAKEWLAPILRKDTGAAVTDSELEYYMDIYIPKFEDSPKVMWQKAQARDAKMRALYGANRGAYDQTFGAPGKWSVLTDSRGQSAGGSRPPPGKARPSLGAIFGK